MRAWNKLSASFVRSVRDEGRYSDGGNLYLQLSNRGKSWIFHTNSWSPTRDGARKRPCGLAGVGARVERRLSTELARGLDPIEDRKAPHSPPGPSGPSR